MPRKIPSTTISALQHPAWFSLAPLTEEPKLSSWVKSLPASRDLSPRAMLATTYWTAWSTTRFSHDKCLIDFVINWKTTASSVLSKAKKSFWVALGPPQLAM
jgi:hypothetical protein